MTLELLARYFHFLGIFGVVSSIAYEFLTVQKSLTRFQILKLAQIDAFYGISSIVILLTGFTMWFWVGKPAEFYGSNWVFYLKIGIFSLIGIASIYPTVFFIKNRKGDQNEEIEIPHLILILIRIELILLLTIPLIAVLMAKGIGQ